MRTFLIAVFACSLSAQIPSTGLRWSKAMPSGAQPSPRIDAPIAYDTAGRQLFLFGGLDASGDRDDLWSYSIDSRQWTQLRPEGTPPKPRHGHTMTYDPARGRMVVLAGQGAGFFGDAWAYDMAANAWIQLSGNTAGPSPRYGHSAVYDSRRERIVLSHGFTSTSGRFDDTWSFDLAANAWRNITPSGTRPLRRCLHHAVYAPQGDRMYLYGGCASGFGDCPQGDLWALDFTQNRWTEVTSNPRPAARQQYGMVFDTTRDKLVLFGGDGRGALNDTWEYDPASTIWARVTPEGSTPEPRSRLESAFAPDLKTAFFFGGQTAGLTGDLLLLTAAEAGLPRIFTSGILDPFTGAGGPFAPGGIVALYGEALGPAEGLAATFDATTGRLPTLHAGVSVFANRIPAPIFYAQAGQVNVQLPYEVDGQKEVRISVSYNGLNSPETTVQLAPAAPRLYPGIFNQDGSLNSSTNRASAGSIVILYATGQGTTNPPTGSGHAAVPPYAGPSAPVRVLVNGQEAEILFSGLAPSTAGVLQVNARIPAGTAGTSMVPVVVSVGTAASQTLTLAVR